MKDNPILVQDPKKIIPLIPGESPTYKECFKGEWKDDGNASDTTKRLLKFNAIR